MSTNIELKIGMILKAARARAGKTTGDIAAAVGGTARMVRFWESDKRLPRYKHDGVNRLEEVFSAYELTRAEREEIIRKICASKQERVETPLRTFQGKRTLPAITKRDKRSVERRVLAQLMDLSPEKFDWVIESANTLRALGRSRKA